jgi:hypothetical protein
MDIIVPQLPFSVSDELANFREDLAQRASDFADTAAAVQADADRIGNIPLELMDSETMGRARSVATRRGDLLRTELAIRTDLANIFPKFEAARRSALNDAREAHRQSQAQVRADLLRIGYLDGYMPGCDWRSIDLRMINHHPDVFTARNAALNIEWHDLGPQRNQNQERLNQLKRQLFELRQRAMAVAGANVATA